MINHWLHDDGNLAMAWHAQAASGWACRRGAVAAAVAVTATAIAKTNPRGVPGGLVTRRMA